MPRNIGPWLGTALLLPLVACVPATAKPSHNNGVSRQVAQAPAQPVQPPTEPGAAQAAQAGADAALKQRVDQLEEQLVDMQVIVGTLESLARGGNAAPATASSGEGARSFGGAADVRIGALETQVRALAAQIEQLTTQVHALASTPRRADAAVQPDAAAAKAAPQSQAAAATRFGSTTVTAGTGDAIGGLIDRETPEATSEPETGATGDAMAAVPPAFMPPPRGAEDAGNPKQLYETAYGYLMQRDYGAAQEAFKDFLKRYPKDSLAGNAQYWLGEAHFVRGEYKAAAGAFLKGYQNYAGNARAADSLLKLAMSLDRLGQRDAACSSFAELKTRFPDAPENVQTHAKSERQRIGCH